MKKDHKEYTTAKELESLTVGEVVKLLNQSIKDDPFMSSFRRRDIERMIRDGAPVNPNGTINFFDFGAWLYTQNEGDDSNEN